MKKINEKDGKLHKVQGYIGIKKRFLVSQKKEDWSYYVYYRIGGRNGKQILKKIGTKSQGITPYKASKIRQILLEKYNPYILLEKGKEKTIDEIWQDYIQKKENLRSIKSIKNLYSYLYPFKYKMPCEITTHDIDMLQIGLNKKISNRKKTLSIQTKVHIIKLLRTLINYGIKRGYCNNNAQLYFEIPKVDNRVTEYLTKNQLKAYIQELDKITNDYAKTFIKIALYTGMRKRAILELEWKNIDFENNYILLEPNKSKKQKTDIIPLPNEIKKILQIFPKKNSFLFKDQNNKELANYSFYAKQLKEKVGLPKHFRPLYMLRHNYASMLASNGIDLYTIQTLLTHENPNMTTRYAHINNDNLKKSANLISKLLNFKAI